MPDFCYAYKVIGQEYQQVEYISNGERVQNVYVESYILENSSRIKSLTTPGIVRKNEPNEFLIEIFSGNKSVQTLSFLKKKIKFFEFFQLLNE